MTEPSERIRAALLRNATARTPQKPAPLDTASKLPVVAISSENLEALLGSGTPKDPKLAPAVEVLLPMLSATDEERLCFAGLLEPVANAAAQSPVHVVLPPESTANGLSIDPVDAVHDVDEDVAGSGHPIHEIIPKAVPDFVFEQVAREEVTVEEIVSETTTESTPVQVAEGTAKPAKSVDNNAAASSEVLAATFPEERASAAALETAPVLEKNPASLKETLSDQTTVSKTEFPRWDSAKSNAPAAPTNNIGSTLFAEAPPPPTEEEIARRESRKQFIRWIAPGVILLLIASGMTTYLLVSRQQKTSPPPTGTVQAAPQIATPPAAMAPLHLDVELESNGQINARWDPSADAVAKARDGRLVVTEQDQAARVMPLTREQLGIGHFSYQPSSDRIEFRLEVVDQNGAVTGESVLAMSPKAAATSGNAAPGKSPGLTYVSAASPAAANSAANLQAIAKPPAPQTSLQRPPSAPVATPSTASVSAPPVNASLSNKSLPNAPLPGGSAEDVQRVRAPPRTFAPPATQQGGEEIRTVILEPPAITTGGAPLPGGVSAQDAFASFAAAPPVGAPAPQRQIRVGGNIQAGLLVKRVTPDYPAVAKTARVQGDVRFSAVIGKDGRIRDLQATGGPAILVPPALAAVKQWVYRPTLLNGQPVEVVTQIDVNFTLGQ